MDHKISDAVNPEPLIRNSYNYKTSDFRLSTDHPLFMAFSISLFPGGPCFFSTVKLSS